MLNPTPPSLAQTVLALTIDSRDYDAIAGDLLEQFRDEKVAALGVPGARRWYCIQVLSYVWRASRMWIGMLAALFVVQDLANSFRRPDGNVYFQTHTPVPLMAPLVFLATGFGAGRRTRSVIAGLVAAAAVQITTLLFMATWWMATFYPFGQIIRNNPYWIAAWHYSGDGESFALWSFYDNIGAIAMATAVLIPTAALCGTIGALAGKRMKQPRTSSL
jgi:hypothetical protein